MAASCPHDCARCRVIEAGLTPPLTRAQMVEVFGVVEPPARNGTRPETHAAADARDVAQAEYDEVHTRVAALRAQLLDARPSQTSEIEAELEAATEELDEAGERLRTARHRYHQLRSEDSTARQREGIEEDRRTFEATRKARRESRPKSRLGNLVRGGR
jgi:chromosome segregation ATPase